MMFAEISGRCAHAVWAVAGRRSATRCPRALLNRQLLAASSSLGGCRTSARQIRQARRRREPVAARAPRAGDKPNEASASSTASAINLSEAPGTTSSLDIEAAIEALQGTWADDIGLSIEISGRQAVFNDGSKPWTFSELPDGGLELRGARLVGPPKAPHWRFENGVERFWARHQVPGADDTDWANAFLGFKAERLGLREQLQKVFAEHDFDRITELKAAWAQPDISIAGLSPERLSTLAGGSEIVPGTCFRHRKFHYRGVVLTCEPFCSFPASWRAMWVPNRPEGEAQPFYRCIVDERDREGRQTRYVAEENMELCATVFPVESALVGQFFTPSVQLGCYLPGPRLQGALQSQLLEARRAKIKV